MPPKVTQRPPKGKGKGKEDKNAPKPKKIPPPPACFSQAEIYAYKDLFRSYDEESTGKVSINFIGTMLRKLGYNPKQYELRELCRLFLEDEFADTVELHEWYFMIEAKRNWGDDLERAVTLAFAALAHDDPEFEIDKKGVGSIDVIKEELMMWGEPLTETEFMPMMKQAKKKKLLDDTRLMSYIKFVEILNDEDAPNRAVPEPLNYFRLDQKALAVMAAEKAEAEREERERKIAEKLHREQMKRARMIAEGMLPDD